MTYLMPPQILDNLISKQGDQEGYTYNTVYTRPFTSERQAFDWLAACQGARYSEKI